MRQFGVSTLGGIADNSKLFEFARELINSLKANHNVIVAGRDIIEIFPDIKYHFFITADLDVRVDRKIKQYVGTITKDELRQHIIKRDELQKNAGFYKISDRTKKIDVSDCNTVEEATNRVLAEIV